jgi:hypothetical protein
MPPRWSLDYMNPEAWKWFQTRLDWYTEFYAHTKQNVLQQLEMPARDLDTFLSGMTIDDLRDILEGNQRASNRTGDPALDLAYQAKILEVVLLRAGSYEYEFLERRAMGMPAPGPDPEAAASKKAYQQLAVNAVLNGPPELFLRLSESRDAVKNTGRAPATQWMHIMLQEGGAAEQLRGDFDGETVEKWMQSLPPDVRGRAMYHLLDAGATKNNTAGTRVTGVEIPYVGGVQWQANGDHWAKVAGNVWLTTSGDVDKMSPAEQDRFYQASRDADPNHQGIADPRPKPTASP